MSQEPQVQRVSAELDGATVTWETGRIARQAHGAVVVRSGRAVVLATVVMAKKDQDPGFLPLTVEYREKRAASGRIPGGFQRREGRISDQEVLTSRILDRSLRPLFPSHFHHEVQVQCTVLSADPLHDDTPMLSLLGASAALHLSSIPWQGPMAGVCVHRIQGRWQAFAPSRDREQADAELVVSAGADGLVMVEGGAENVADDEVLKGLLEAQRKIQRLLPALVELREKAGFEKVEFPAPEPPPWAPTLDTWLQEHAKEPLDRALHTVPKPARSAALSSATRALVDEATTACLPPEADSSVFVADVRSRLSALTKKLVRREILESRTRIDARGPGDIRGIWGEVDWLPSVHGSALFTRGETQAIVSCTLATQKMEQKVETLFGTESLRFLLHYNFPPYSVGEARPLRGPGRREIGHGNLARRALLPVLPAFEDFPYVVRLESDIAESNGSSSMATTCGGCLAMMDAGVPLKDVVAGIAMGLIAEGERFEVLSDILGDEDHLGDMDFKVTGTHDGITALQMDNKVGALPESVLRQALDQARKGRRHILGEMRKVLSESRKDLKEHAPRITRVRIAPEAMGQLIGPRGANIRDIEATHDAQVSVDESGVAYVAAPDREKSRAAVARVEQAAGVVQRGKDYTGTVVTVKPFGAFVKIFDSAEGLVPVEEWSDREMPDFVNRVKEGERVSVRVLGVDERGRLRLSRKESSELVS